MWSARRRPSADPSSRPSTTGAAAIFRRVRLAAASLLAWRRPPLPRYQEPYSPEPTRIVLYYTTLGVVRKTYEDCRYVRSILRGFRVAIDERDVSMDASFLRELGDPPLDLPKVFIGGELLGGAEEIRRLHEAGELKAVVEGVPLADFGVCQLCGGNRFAVCWSCDGSHRSYCEDTDDFVACDACNENGLIRCPECNRTEPV